MNFIQKTKGFTLIELLLVMLLAGFIATAVTSLFVFGTDTFKGYSRYSAQQDRILEAMRRVGKDISEASKFRLNEVSGSLESITLFFSDPSVQSKTWRFTEDSSDASKDNKLELKVGEAAGTEFQTVLDGILTPESRFIYNQSGNRIIIMVQPSSTNSGKFAGLRVADPVTMEFSVKYKIKM